MDWNLIGTIAGTTFTVVGFVYAILRNFKTDINSHIDRLDERMNKFDQRFESWIMHSTARMDSQSKRTDQLYEMYVNTNKQINDLQKNLDQKFYDVLKEAKK